MAGDVLSTTGLTVVPLASDCTGRLAETADPRCTVPWTCALAAELCAIVVLLRPPVFWSLMEGVVLTADDLLTGADP